MFSRLCGMADGITLSVHVYKKCATEGQFPNKSPTFTTVNSDTHTSLDWLLASCLSDLMAKHKAEIMTVVSSKPNNFEATVSAMRCRFSHSLSSGGLLCKASGKNIGKRMSERVVLEELETLNIRLQEVMQLRPCRRHQHSAKNSPPILT
jgi:hypothetical protein